jgi:aldose 1-epimerase
MTGHMAHEIYAGAIVGPIANRIAGGQVRMDRATWQMPLNDGGNTLHSGPAGLHVVTWQVLSQSETSVNLAADLADGAAGLPGHRRIEVRYEIQGANLDLQLSAISDKDTYLNLAHHPYWTLDKHDTIGRHRLRVHAERYLPTDDQLIPTGDIAPVADTPYDFREARTVPDDISLDATLCLSQDRRPSPRQAATLMGPTGICLDIETTEAGLQVYNGSHLPTANTRMHPGQRLAPFAAMALEPQGWPDAPNHAAFPSILLRAHRVYRQHTRYLFSRKS